MVVSLLDNSKELNMFNRLYVEFIGCTPEPLDKLGTCLLSEFISVCDENLEMKIRKMLEKIPEFVYTIKENRKNLPFYDQGIILFIIYLFYRHHFRLVRDWPIDHDIMRRIASNIGVSLDV
jgi:hypothetical protein